MKHVRTINVYIYKGYPRIVIYYVYKWTYSRAISKDSKIDRFGGDISFLGAPTMHVPI